MLFSNCSTNNGACAIKKDVANKFKRMRKAFNVAMKNGQSDSDTTGSVGGATLRRRQKRYRRSKNTYRKTHKSTTKRR